MVPGYQAVLSWITAHEGEVVGDAWEVYLSDPTAQPDPATWRTGDRPAVPDRTPALGAPGRAPELFPSSGAQARGTRDLDVPGRGLYGFGYFCSGWGGPGRWTVRA